MLLLLLFGFAAAPAQSGCVVLIHGVTRTPASLTAMERVLTGAGYHVINWSYPSTSATLETLAPGLDRAFSACGDSPPHVVTHSMGAIVLRTWLLENPDAELGRVVMLAPPNSGSELIDAMRDLPGFARVLGPAGLQLGTGPDGPAGLPPMRGEIGVIAGTRSISALAAALIEGPNDGKVSVASTRLAGMTGHRTVAATHTFLMNHPVALAETLGFLRTGRFREELGFGAALAEVAPYLLD